MKYIIMCGGKYDKWTTPRQMTQIKGESIAGRTIRLLRETGVEDISISTSDNRFETLGVPLLKHDNNFHAYHSGHWVDAFYPTDDPTCYLFGDVVFSPDAIKTIVNTQTDDVEFFASAPPFDKRYIKRWAEPFAFKVRNQKRFRAAIDYVKQNMGLFRRHPIAWELWQVIKETPLNLIDYTNYTAINDYTCDIDDPADAVLIQAGMEAIV